MTEAEALEILKRDDDDMRKGYFCLNDFTALEVAKKALEKQIPKKPILKQWCPAICPCCGRSLSENLGDGYYEHNTHKDLCDKCGQKLDWSEV